MTPKIFDRIEHATSGFSDAGKGRGTLGLVEFLTRSQYFSSLLGAWISAPLADIKRSIYERGAIMYPVSNKSFRDWRARHVRGGDFIAYTEARRIRLPQNLVVSL